MKTRSLGQKLVTRAIVRPSSSGPRPQFLTLVRRGPSPNKTTAKLQFARPYSLQIALRSAVLQPSPKALSCKPQSQETRSHTSTAAHSQTLNVSNSWGHCSLQSMKAGRPRSSRVRKGHVNMRPTLSFFHRARGEGDLEVTVRVGSLSRLLSGIGFSSFRFFGFGARIVKLPSSPNRIYLFPRGRWTPS